MNIEMNKQIMTEGALVAVDPDTYLDAEILLRSAPGETEDEFRARTLAQYPTIQMDASDGYDDGRIWSTVEIGILDGKDVELRTTGVVA